MDEGYKPKITDKVERELYEKCHAKNNLITEKDWMELRRIALSAHTPGVKKFFEVAGVVMENKPDTDTINQLKDKVV